MREHLVSRLRLSGVVASAALYWAIWQALPFLLFFYLSYPFPAFSPVTPHLLSCYITLFYLFLVWIYIQPFRAADQIPQVSLAQIPRQQTYHMVTYNRLMRSCMLSFKSRGNLCKRQRNNNNRLRITGSRLWWALSDRRQSCDPGRHLGTEKSCWPEVWLLSRVGLVTVGWRKRAESRRTEDEREKRALTSREPCGQNWIS